MNEWWNQYILIQLKYPSEFWLCFLLFHQKCPVKTERGGSREFGNGIFPSALALPSAINRETPDFGPYLPVSRLEYEISQIIAKSLPFLVNSTFWQWDDRDDQIQRVFFAQMTSSIIPSLSTLNICKCWGLAALPSLSVNNHHSLISWAFAWILVYRCTLKLVLL